MNNAPVSLVVFLAVCGSSFAGTKPFERVETFPAGEQASGFGALIKPKTVNTEAVSLNKPYDAVWSAVKIVARQFDKVGKRPLVAIDEAGGRVQNGKISGDAIIAGNTFDWKDEFVIEVTRGSAQSTTLSVSRRVVKKGTGWGDTNTNWQSRNSNGQIERWLITQVIDQMKQPISEWPVESSATVILVTYVDKADDKNYIELNGDGSFRLFQLGKQYRGRYALVGEDLTLTQGTRAIKSRVKGDSMWDDEGKEWIKRAGGPQPSPTGALARKDGDSSFTNADVLKLVEAKLPDSIIISRIKSSGCNFDVSTDALIKLKSANAGDAVVKAIVDCKP